MKILLLSCSTGEGHNHCAKAVKEALDRRGHDTEFLDMLHLFGEPGPLSVETALNTISTRAPEVFGLMYKAGEMFSATGVTSPVYVANLRHARALREFILERGYDAVVCSHLFPMETLTFLRRRFELPVFCCGLLSDYACIPFLAETELDRYFLPHEEVLADCVRAGMDEKTLTVTGMPVADTFRQELSREQARSLLGVAPEKKLYLIMTGGVGCGDVPSLCEAILKFPDESSLLCVLAGRNRELQERLAESFSPERGVQVVPFTDKVAVYMRAADVLLSKAGGISSSEAAVLNVPLVHTMAIPGIETLNAAFFARHGLSCFAKSPDEAARFADRLIYDEAAARRMLAAQRACVPRDAAERIAAWLEAGCAARK